MVDIYTKLFSFQLSLSIPLIIGVLLLKDFDEYDELSSGGDYAKVVAWLLIANSVISLIDLLIGFFGLRFSSNCLLMLVWIVCIKKWMCAGYC